MCDVREPSAPCPDAADETRELSSGELWRPYLKMAVVLGVLAAFALILRLTPLSDLFSDVKRLQHVIDGQGILAHFAFFGVATELIFLGAPRLIFCTVGGALFGFAEGLVLAQLSALIGGLGPFLFARWWRSPSSQERFKLVARAREYLRRGTILDIFLLRQLPVWGALLNAILGASDVPLKTFLVGSFLGYLPQSVVFSLIGSGFGETTTLHAVSRVFAAASVLVLAFVLSFRIMRRKKGSSS